MTCDFSVANKPYHPGVDADERARFRRFLETKLAELRAEGGIEIEPTRRDPMDKPDEDEAPLAEMMQAIASSRNQERANRISGMQRALDKLVSEPEDFGSCERCEEEIEAKRLELLPWSTLCVRCQSEGEEPRGGRRHLTDYE
jgi:DnaK suppressor protein